MNCPSCGASYSIDDNYCSHCGVPLRGARLPVPLGSWDLPVPWEQVRSGLVRGAAVVALGTAAELLRREVMRRATPSNMADALTRLWRMRPRRREEEAQSAPVPAQPALETSEGVTEIRSFFFRRIIVRH